ncbi:MAG: hypothetical protein RLZZ505_669 [Verrucomicrobiota bacterium]|jgi:hypothetical protein
MHRHRFRIFQRILLLLAVSVPSLRAAEPTPLADVFKAPPKETHPVLWWRFMDDYATREGMVADLDAMKRIGLAGAVVSYCSSRSGVGKPKPGAPFVPMLTPAWWENMDFTLKQAAGRDLDLWFQLCPGYATSGGPWITPELSMQKLVWSQGKCTSEKPFDEVLPTPNVDKKWNYYRDVAVLAFPDGKGAIDPRKIIDLTSSMNPKGHLTWKPKDGAWIIVRLGHTTTGVPVHPVTEAGYGLECDKLSKEATRHQFNSYFRKIADKRPAGSNSKVELFFDSWEAQNQNWTPTFREEFTKRRGYDPLPWLLVATKRIVGSEELSRRFDHDWKTTIEELINDNHFAELIRLSHESGAKQLRAQPYNGPINFMTAGALFDIPEAEYWLNKREYGWWSLRMIASVAHINGKKIAAAESLTAMPANHRMNADPFSTKAQTDLAFTMGINSMAIHASAHNPWPKHKPGMTSGFFPPLVGGWQTWNDLAGSWITYLSRCCFLLQQGSPSADVVKLFRPSEKGYELIPGHASDLCNEELIVSSMTFDGKALCLPSGMRYQILELPDTTTVVNAQLSPSGIEKQTGRKPLPQSMSLPLLRKVRELVLAGATVLGPRPEISSGLNGYPESDKELQAIATELWGAKGSATVDRKVGKGRVLSGITITEALARINLQPDFMTVEKIPSTDVPWIHRKLGEEDWYFVSNQRNKPLRITASFRVSGKVPELWHADTGTTEPARNWTIRDGRTEVVLNFAPRGSVFVRLSPGKLPSLPVKLAHPKTLESSTVEGPWKVRFSPEMGAPAEVDFPKLISWADHPEKEIRHYSGIATYQREIKIPATKGRIILDLGQVKNLARVTVNGTAFPELWKPPFTCDITSAVKAGSNTLCIEVANLWANRLIGDEQEPADIEWDTTRKSGGIMPLATLPDWLLQGKPRPSSNRRAFSTWNYIQPKQKLLPSGLLGPVSIKQFSDP